MKPEDNILNLVSHGRKALENGELKVAKLYAMELAKVLDMYIPFEDEFNLVDGFLREILLVQQVAQWKEKGKPEYYALRDLAERRIQSQDDLLKNLDKIFG